MSCCVGIEASCYEVDGVRLPRMASLRGRNCSPGGMKCNPGERPVIRFATYGLHLLSSAFLALSVTFIKDVVSPIATANWLPLLYVSWFSFCGAIISTVCSFMIGQHGYKTLRDAAERYYIKGERSAFSVSVVISRRIECANILSGALFVIGVIAVLFFVFLNVLGR